MKQPQEKILKRRYCVRSRGFEGRPLFNTSSRSSLMAAIGQDFANYFAEEKITKVVTLEASGITLLSLQSIVT